jgi:hypothetical protein
VNRILRIGTSDKLFAVLCSMKSMFCLAERLLASEEGLL